MFPFCLTTTSGIRYVIENLLPDLSEKEYNYIFERELERFITKLEELIKDQIGFEKIIEILKV